MLVLLRPPVLRGRAVPPRVHVAAHQAVAALPGPAAGLGREAAQLPAERLPSVSQVSPRRSLAQSDPPAVGWFCSEGFSLLQGHVQRSERQQHPGLRDLGTQTTINLK